MYPCTVEPRPTAAAARTAAPFSCPAFPLCASYVHPQDGKHNTDGAAAAAAAAGSGHKHKGAFPGRGAGDARFVSTL